ncbi:MAG: protoporphyrinogen oxidase, partial [Polyangia bacterium]
VERALADLATVAGLKRRPDVTRVWKYREGIPLYVPGHAARLATLEEALRPHPGLLVIGHGLRGAGVNESIRAAAALVRTELPAQP